MKRLGFLLASSLSISLLGANLAVLAQDAPDAGTVKPMFKEGEFKCSDGYDPDTDAKLHPANQNPKTRAFVNAQAQKAHEDALPAAESGKEKAPEGEAAGNASSHPEAIKDIADEKKGDKKEEKKDEKKAGEKKEEDKTADKKDDKTKASAAKLDAKEAANPLNQALFAIQSKKYQNSIDVLKTVLLKDEKNAQAHYLMAVSYVGLRRYPEAKEQYNTVLKLASANPKLTQMAEQGLKRISGSN